MLIRALRSPRARYNPASENGWSPARRYDVADTPTWAHPVPTSQGVLVKDDSSLALWKLSP
jgi:hypothetical protein